MVLGGPPGLGIAFAIALGAALAAAAPACSHSLFDNHPGGGPGAGGDAGSDGAGAASACPDGCIGDAAANFDGTDTGATHVWRYLEDQGRAWMPMTPSSSTMMGQLDAANQITTCRTRNAPACAELPGAVLMSSGAASAVDPAIEFTTPGTVPQVIQLSLHAYQASGDAQTIRIYRNSREDLLFTAPLGAMQHVDQSIVVDALPGDRFLVAVSGSAAASNVALQLYVNATGQAFPTSCQLALSFTGLDATTSKIVDPCSPYTFSSFKFTAPPPAQSFAPAPFVPGPGPYPEQMSGIAVAQDMFLQRDGTAQINALDWSHDITVQLWAQPIMLAQLSSASFLFADFDVDACGGIELSVRAPNGGNPRIALRGCTSPATMAETTITPAFPLDGGWHFVRVVRTAAEFDLCIDGVYADRIPVQPGAVVSNNPPDLGKSVTFGDGAAYIGGFDDVRAFRGALPCRPPP